MNDTKTTTPLFYISRNFVEFGGFSASEITSFKQRGIISDQDYIRPDQEPNWIPLHLWVSDSAEQPVSAKPAKKTATRKRPSTAKAAKKAA